MAELKISQDERPGILKEIDDGAIDLIFQAIQEDMYSYPIKSFVRESISNALDAIVERHIAAAILINGEEVNKYYLDRNDGKLLKDSVFDPDYYNTDHFGEDNKVYVRYTDGQPRDTISIRDYGVGLGGSRLKGFFKLGYSSKRNMKDVIGKFGAGAKAGLATGVEYFTLTTVYDGFKTSFMIFKNDYENITSHHPDGKTELWNVKLTDQSMVQKEIYWEPTGEPNGVMVELPVKKHNKYQFLREVKNQFQYFKGSVVMEYKDEEGFVTSEILDSPAHYESKNIIIPQYSTYSAPHILVDNITYGKIAWNELEMENRKGRVGIKVHATDVDITQSRESLKWTEITKTTINRAIDKAREEAEDYVAQQLKVEQPGNVFELINKYAKVGKDSDDVVTKSFAEFLNMHRMAPSMTWQGQPVRLDQDFFDLYFYETDIKQIYTSYNQIEQKRITSFDDLKYGFIVYGHKKYLGPKLIGHLMEKHEIDSLIYIRPNTTRMKQQLDYKGGVYSRQEVGDQTLEDMQKYANIVIDTYEIQYDESDEKLEGESVPYKNVAAIERKKNAEVIYTTLKPHPVDSYHVLDSSNPVISELDGKPLSTGYYYNFPFNMTRKTVKIANLKHEFDGIEKKNVVICPGNYKSLGKLIGICEKLVPVGTIVVHISQEVLKHFLPHGIHIAEYFRKLNLETGELMIGEHIRTLNTIRQFQIVASKYSYSKYYDLLKQITTLDVGELIKYDRTSNKFIDDIIGLNELFDDTAKSELFEYLQSLRNLQDVIQTGNKESIAEHALAHLGTDKIYHLQAYDSDLIAEYEQELQRIKPLEPLLYAVSNSGNISDSKPLLELLLRTIQNQSTNDNI